MSSQDVPLSPLPPRSSHRNNRLSAASLWAPLLPRSDPTMARLSSSPRGAQKPGRAVPLKLILSYVFDWVILIVFALVATYLSDIEPIKRPFSLENPTISFPFTEHETVPVALLFITNAAVPILIILVVTFIFVPGPTVPKGTPRSMIWRRKLWELHIGWLGMALAMCCCMFVTNGLKNMFGKARPDLLARCVPDMANLQKYTINTTGLLVYPGICTQPDKSKLDDGFRSFPSGHASSSAAGLIYLSLFLASKFTITIPFIAPAGYPTDASYAAFPSRSTATVTGGNTITSNTSTVPRSLPRVDDSSDLDEHAAASRIASHTMAVYAVRRQAAAPPLYLLGLALLPTFAAVFIASSRWWDYRHHAFDIGSGFLIGTVSAFFAFRYYHMPISQGAGWAWGPRSNDKAFWGGLGSYSYATDRQKWYVRPGDEEEGTMGITGRDVELGGMVPRVPTVPIVNIDSGESSAVTKLSSRVGTDKSSGN